MSEQMREMKIVQLLEFLLPGKWHGHDLSVRPVADKDWTVVCQALIRLGLLKIVQSPDGEIVETTDDGIALLQSLSGGQDTRSGGQAQVTNWCPICEGNAQDTRRLDALEAGVKSGHLDIDEDFCSFCDAEDDDKGLCDRCDSCELQDTLCFRVWREVEPGMKKHVIIQTQSPREAADAIIAAQPGEERGNHD